MLETVVLIHGIWMTGADMLLLKKRIGDCGFSSHIFRYQSVNKSPFDNSKLLDIYVNKLKANKVHFVAHSLGGIVLLNYFHNAQVQKDGKAVLLGSPINGSVIAKQASTKPLLKTFLGKSINKGLLEKAPMWKGHRQVAMIAGTKSLGLGFVAGSLDGINDGEVLLSETQYDGLTAHTHLAVSHSELLFSQDVADNVCSFIINGEFGKYQTSVDKQDLNSWIEFFKDLIK